MAKKQSGGSRKLGRGKVRCAAYRAAGRREKNKKLKLKIHYEKHPNDKQAKKEI